MRQKDCSTMKKILCIFLLFTGCLLNSCTKNELEKHMESLKSNDPKLFITIHYRYEQMENLDTFLSSVENGENAHLDILSYTIEGDPMFTHIEYNGDTFYYVFDGSRDPYLSDKSLRTSTYAHIRVAESETNDHLYRYLILTNQDDLSSESLDSYQDYEIAAVWSVQTEEPSK